MSLSTKKIVTCGVAVALAFVCSCIKLFSLPFGGSVTLFSMFFITIIGYWYGTVTGILVGILYGLIQFIQNPVYLCIEQVLLDYVFSFGSLGLSGLFKNKKHGLYSGYLFAIVIRGLFSSIAAFFFWMDYMPDSFPKQISFLYPFVYNYGYILTEGIITLIILSLPVVNNAIQYVKHQVL